MIEHVEDIKGFITNADGLLLELCEAGIYELDSPVSPEGYIDVARAAVVLDKAVRHMREKYATDEGKDGAAIERADEKGQE